MKKGIALTAIFVLVASMVGVGSITAMPEDLAGWRTPSEQAWYYGHKLTALEDSMAAQGLNEMQVSQRMDVLKYRYQAKLAKYTRTFNYINVTQLTTDEGLVDVGNSSIWVGRRGVNINAGDLVVVPYMQRQVDNKVSDLELDPANKNIEVSIVIERVIYTYPGGPIIRLYHFEVTWDIFEEMY